MAAWKDIRVFVSSTFRDMQAERDYLVKKVFPRLRAALEKHRVRLTEIDLRWGITEEQERNDEVLEFCLREVDRCRPFFLGLLGERYGTVPRLITAGTAQRYPWVPLLGGSVPSLTELEVLHGVLNSPLDRAQSLFYLRDPAPLTHVDPFARSFLTDDTGGDDRLTNRLAELKQRLHNAGVVRHGCYPWRFEGLKIRWQLASAGLDAEMRKRLEAHMRNGLLRTADLQALEADPVLANFLKAYATVELSGLEKLGARVFADLWNVIAVRVLENPALQPEEGPTNRTSATADSLPDSLPERSNILRGWIRAMTGEGAAGDLNMALNSDEWSYWFRRSMVLGAPKLMPMLREAETWYQRRRSDDVAHLDTQEQLQMERDFHDRFADSKLRGYVRRREVEREMVNHLLSHDASVLVLGGDAGSGKSALMARCYRVARWLSRKGASRCVAHFVGASPESTSQRGLLAHLCMELACLPRTEAGELPLGTDQLAAVLARRLAEGGAGHERPLFLFIDALDQLEPGHGANDLEWIPVKLAAHVRIMVSVAEPQSQIAAKLQRLHAALAIRDSRHLHLADHPLDDETCRKLLRRIPSLAAKSLSSDHLTMLLGNRATRNPLYLRVALEELRGFGSHELLSARIEQMKNATDPEMLFEQVIEWACLDFPAALVRRILSAVAASRHGMSESELCRHATESPETDAMQGSSSAAEETAALLKHLGAYFQRRGPLLDFHHRSLTQAVERLWLDRDEDFRATHLKLAGFFDVSSKSQDGWREASRRSVSEVFYHRLAARDWRGILTLLDDDDYCRQRGRSPDYRVFADEMTEAFLAAPENYAVALAVAFSREADQQTAMRQVTARVLAAVGRSNSERLAFMSNFFGGRSPEWRGELLMAAGELITAACHSAAAPLLEVLDSSYEGPDEVDSNRVTALQHLATIRSSEGRCKEAVLLADEGIRMSEKLGDHVNENILRATLVSIYVKQGRRAEARDLALNLWKSERETLSRSIVPRAILYAFDEISASLPPDEMAQLGTEAAAIAKEKNRFHEYALLKQRLAHLAQLSGNHQHAMELLRDALVLPVDAYSAEVRRMIESQYASISAQI